MILGVFYVFVSFAVQYVLAFHQSHWHLGTRSDRQCQLLAAVFESDYDYQTILYMGVSKNRGTPKWMVYDGKPY